MASTIFELARNPAVQARMVQEIDRVGLKTVPTYEDLPKLSYVEAVFQACNLLFRMHGIFSVSSLLERN